jgi:cobalt-zinc-cadmium efflux system outer membrane protein
MRRPFQLAGLAYLLVFPLIAQPARGQIAQLADDLILLTNRLRAKEQAKTHIHLGPGPGKESPFPVVPGAPGTAPGEPSSSLTPGFASITPVQAMAPMPTPLHGALDLPTTPDEGPANGLTLDQAIEQLLHDNYDLRTRFQELDKAQADILTAGLRNNPFVFGNVGNIPYQPYSLDRPGGANYEVTVIQAFDVNHKRVARIRVAKDARSVLEALYQDAVRQQIDNLYTAFIDVLAAREAVRQQKIGLTGLEEVAKTTRTLIQSKSLPATEEDNILIQRDSAALAVTEAETAMRQAKQSLAVLLNLTPECVDRLEVRGAVVDTTLIPPCLPELVRVALTVRPDLEAYRLGIRRAQSEVELAKRERIADVFVLYTPWALQENAGAQSANSWSLGALVTLPVFNRNQGNIARAQTTVTQVEIELQGRERQVVAEVERAYAEYTTTRQALEQFQKDILPRARRIREDKYKLFTTGSAGLLSYLNAQKDYNDIVRRYLEIAIRHRRSMLRLNTAVGQRISP